MAQTAYERLSHKRRAFVDHYVSDGDFNGAKSARLAGYSERSARQTAARLLANNDIQTAIKERVSEIAMSADEVLVRLAEQARADLGQFFKVVEEWTFYPLPSYDILDAEEVEDTSDSEHPEKRVSYLVRHIAVDTDKLTDPRHSHLLHKFSDSPRNGVEVELYNKQSALTLLGKTHGLLLDKAAGSGDGASTENNRRTLTIPADLLASSFVDANRDINGHKHTEYLFHGGRGSTKSSFISLTLICQLVNHPGVHALVTRQVGNTLRDSVYAQLQWAISELSAYYPGLSDDFKCTTSPMEITYLPTGQKVYFRGLDDPGKIKSITPVSGYIGLFWLEEADQARSAEHVRKIEQSLRGGDFMLFFKSWNPPRSAQNWINKYVQVPKPNQFQHTSDYRAVPRDWLGDVFLAEAEHLKTVNEKAYDNEYLGVVTGTGGQVFENVTLRPITDAEIAQFDHLYHGLDFGFSIDPAHYTRMHFDAARRVLYVFGEARRWKTSNEDMYAAIKAAGYDDKDLLIADSAEPKSINDLRVYGAKIRGAEKGKDSVRYSMRFLENLTAIIIDSERCPYTAAELLNYEYEQNSQGEYLSEYPDANNHAIDSLRYGLNLIIRRRGDGK